MAKEIKVWFDKKGDYIEVLKYYEDVGSQFVRKYMVLRISNKYIQLLKKRIRNE